MLALWTDNLLWFINWLFSSFDPIKLGLHLLHQTVSSLQFLAHHLKFPLETIDHHLLLDLLRWALLLIKLVVIYLAS
jgi:hypothetical protein